MWRKTAIPLFHTERELVPNLDVNTTGFVAPPLLPSRRRHPCHFGSSASQLTPSSLDLAPQIVSVKRDVAEATRPELGGAYEGCLDQFERGMSTTRLRQVFAELKSGLVPLLRAIENKVRASELEMKECTCLCTGRSTSVQ